MKQEIERKYMVTYLPEDLKIVEVLDIQQAFIYKDTNTVIRVRNIQNKELHTEEYIYTIKTKGDLELYTKSSVAQVYEIESYIQKEEFDELIKKKISNIIEKTRLAIPIENDLKVEIDIYKNDLQDLITAEVEFPNEHMANSFEKPKWLGEEIGYAELSNWRLSNMTKEQWKTKLTKEILDNNRKILQNLKKI